MHRTTIYIPLLNEGTDVWRPVEAEQVGGDQYRIVGQRPADENWPFAQNQIVRCEMRLLSGRECLVAQKGPTP